MPSTVVIRRFLPEQRYGTQLSVHYPLELGFQALLLIISLRLLRNHLH